MGDLSKNFSRSEFACKCGCGSDAVHPLLVDCLQSVRDAVDAAVIVTSGVRCEAHNAAVGGAKGSYHLPQEDGLGYAADIIVEGFTPSEVYKMLDDWYPRTKGIGRYNGWVHFDVREDVKARWVG